MRTLSEPVYVSLSDVGGLKNADFTVGQPLLKVNDTKARFLQERRIEPIEGDRLRRITSQQEDFFNLLIKIDFLGRFKTAVSAVHQPFEVEQSTLSAVGGMQMV